MLLLYCVVFFDLRQTMETYLPLTPHPREEETLPRNSRRTLQLMSCLPVLPFSRCPVVFNELLMPIFGDATQKWPQKGSWPSVWRQGSCRPTWLFCRSLSGRRWASSRAPWHLATSSALRHLYATSATFVGFVRFLSI